MLYDGQGEHVCTSAGTWYSACAGCSQHVFSGVSKSSSGKATAPQGEYWIRWVVSATMKQTKTVVEV